MHGRSTWVGVVLAGVVASGAVAQSPQPTGMVSPTNGILFTNDGVPDGVGDLEGILEPGQGTGIYQLNLGNANCDGSVFPINSSPANNGGSPSGVVDGFGLSNPNDLTVSGYDTSDTAHPRPTSAHYDEPFGNQATGNGTLIDTDGDHRYEGIDLLGARGPGGSTLVDVTLALVPADVDNDDVPDYVTVNNTLPFDFAGLNCTVPAAAYNQVWIPLAEDLDGDLAIIADLDGNGEADRQFAWGPKLEFLVTSVVEVPTVSGFGVAVLTLALLAAAVHLLRRRGTASAA